MANSWNQTEMRNTRVLLVDDQESVRNAAYSVLESGGYDVVAASNGPDGIEHLSPIRYIPLSFS